MLHFRKEKQNIYVEYTYNIQSIKTIKLMLIRKKRRKNGKKEFSATNRKRARFYIN